MTIRPRGLAPVVFGCFDGHKIVYDAEFVRDLKSEELGRGSGLESVQIRISAVRLNRRSKGSPFYRRNFQ